MCSSWLHFWRFTYWIIVYLIHSFIHREYTFRVSAENKAGQGPPAQSEKPIAIKEPLGMCSYYICSMSLYFSGRTPFLRLHDDVMTLSRMIFMTSRVIKTSYHALLWRHHVLLWRYHVCYFWCHHVLLWRHHTLLWRHHVFLWRYPVYSLRRHCVIYVHDVITYVLYDIITRCSDVIARYYDVMYIYSWNSTTYHW